MTDARNRRVRDGLGDAYGDVDEFINRRQSQVFALLGRYLPEPEIARNLEFQHILTSKLLSSAGLDAIRYTALVVVIRNGGSAFDAAIVGVAILLPSILFALYGGSIADSLPKRVAIGGAYLADAAACVFIPLLFGTSSGAMVALALIVATLTQVSSPAEKTVVPLVSSQEQLASAVSLMGLATSVGAALGVALFAPLLLKKFGPDAVFTFSAILLVIAMSRIVHVSSKQDVQRVRFVRPKADFRRIIRWFAQNPAIATMVGVAVISGVGYTIMTTLAPTYVHDVLGLDPANTIFVIGVAGAGTTLALLVNPLLLRRISERWVAGLGFLLEAFGLIGLGLVSHGIADVIDPVNPLRLLSYIGVDVGEPTRTAMLLALPLGLGNGMTDNAVRTYLSRRVPFAFQSRTFAMQGLLESAATVAPLLGVSAIATAAGVSPVLILTPLLLYGVAIGLVRLSAWFGGEPPPAGRRVFTSYWEEPGTPLTDFNAPLPSAIDDPEPEVSSQVQG